MEYLSAAHALGIITIMNPSPLPNADQIREFPWGKLTWLIVNEGEARDLLTSVGDTSTVDTIELVLPPEGAPEGQETVRSAHTMAQNWLVIPRSRASTSFAPLVRLASSRLCP